MSRRICRTLESTRLSFTPERNWGIFCATDEVDFVTRSGSIVCMARPEEILDLMRDQAANTLAVVRKAYDFAERAYGERSIHGIAAFEHAFETAKIVADPKLHLGPRAVATALLQDVLGLGATSEHEVLREFGREMLFLLQSLHTLAEHRPREGIKHKESLMKFILASSHDLRVLIILLAKRLQQLRRIAEVASDERAFIAQETLELYAPLANRLSMRDMKAELEDRAFAVLQPAAHREILRLVKSRERAEKVALEDFRKSLLRLLAKDKLRHVATEVRVKNIYGIFRKLKEKGALDAIYDTRALRLIVPSIADCYRALGIIHSRFVPLPGRIKDYIASPKPNGYQSLHTTVFTGEGTTVEVQIRTHEMQHYASFGMAAHENYKSEDGHSWSYWFAKFFPLPPQSEEEEASLNRYPYTGVPSWVKKLVNVESYVEIMSPRAHELHDRFFRERMFIFDNGGDIIDLPCGATVIDFAFAMNPKKGMNLFGAKVNGKLAQLETELHNNDVVSLFYRRTAKPSRKWLTAAKTQPAREQISRYLPFPPNAA